MPPSFCTRDVKGTTTCPCNLSINLKQRIRVRVKNEYKCADVPNESYLTEPFQVLRNPVTANATSEMISSNTNACYIRTPRLLKGLANTTENRRKPVDSSHDSTFMSPPNGCSIGYTKHISSKSSSKEWSSGEPPTDGSLLQTSTTFCNTHKTKQGQRVSGSARRYFHAWN